MSFSQIIISVDVSMHVMRVSVGVCVFVVTQHTYKLTSLNTAKHKSEQSKEYIPFEISDWRGWTKQSKEDHWTVLASTASPYLVIIKSNTFQKTILILILIITHWNQFQNSHNNLNWITYSVTKRHLLLKP
jgi:hypothetical protein